MQAAGNDGFTFWKKKSKKGNHFRKSGYATPKIQIRYLVLSIVRKYLGHIF